METSKIFDKAVEYRDKGKYEEALELLLTLNKELFYSTSFLAVLADTNWELNRYDEAIKAFRSAVEFSPKSETLSLSLFHCLLDSGDVDGAFEEMRRFLLVSDSDEYRRLLSEIS